MTDNDSKHAFAARYLDAVTRKDFRAFEELLAPDVTFQGPAATLSGVREVTAAYRLVSTILVRNDLKKAFADGDDLCLIYDFVTDTPSGAVLTMEWLRLDHGKVRSIRLLTDHVKWPPAVEEARRRAAKA